MTIKDVPEIDTIPEPATEASEDIQTKPYRSFNDMTQATVAVFRGALGFRFGPMSGADAARILSQCVEEGIPAILSTDCGPEFDWELARDMRGSPPGQGPDAGFVVSDRDDPHRAIVTRYTLLLPGEDPREGTCLLPREPTLDQVRAIVCPLLGTQTIEHVQVADDANSEDPVSMYVDEMGHPKALAFNTVATIRYQRGRQTDHFIAGPAVIFERRV